MKTRHFQQCLGETAKSQLAWLGVNLCTAFFASRDQPDETIEKVVALAA